MLIAADHQLVNRDSFSYKQYMAPKNMAYNRPRHPDHALASVLAAGKGQRPRREPHQLRGTDGEPHPG